MIFSQISLEITNSCNFKCDYCPSKNISRARCSMPLSLVKAIVDEIAQLRLLGKNGYIAPFLLGEPLLHPQYAEIFAYIKSKGIKLFLNTNGSLLSKENIDFLYAIGTDRITVNLSKSRNEFQARKAPVSFEAYLDNIGELIYRHIKSKPATKLHIDVMFRKDELINIFDGMGSLEALISKLFGKDKFEVFINEARKELAGKWLVRIPGFAFKKEISPGVSFVFCAEHGWGNTVNCQKHPIKKALFGSCNALRDNGQIAILACGTYTLCCGDYDGKARLPYNYADCHFSALLKKKEVADIAFKFKTCRLPFEFCRYCRGGAGRTKALFNQINSCLYYNLPNYRALRNLLIRKI